ncbi:MAG: UDP-3-O-(3-hydroxymyristoyl)glucosamine N-acyltransferase [Caulobacteraceae bacterium]|nr:UDP-3-O-(3-hydroxymyristoyl)glucosamine N-acyltransferase [Caulobacteraceae bacterium]
MTNGHHTVRDLAEILEPLILGLAGSLDRPIVAPCPSNRPIRNGLTFVRNPGALGGDAASLLTGLTVICPVGLDAASLGSDVTTILVENPRFAFARAVGRLFGATGIQPGAHPTAVVDPSAEIDLTASIGANCSVGRHCKVGAGSILHPNVVLYDKVRLGDNVVVHSGTVIGSDGFGYERGEDGEFEKFPHVGGVLIESDVEIGSNTSIDRGALADTIIRRGAKIDNQIHISHNVVIGRATAVIAQSMLGGSVEIGDYGWVAPSACVMNQRKLGARSTVGLQALVVKDVPSGTTVMGSPAVTQEEFQRERRALKALIVAAEERDAK